MWHRARVRGGCPRASEGATTNTHDADEVFEVRRLEVAYAEAIASWRYPGRYATYDVREVVTDDRGFWAVVRGDDLVGYCCFGAEARMPGVEEDPGTLDVGYGMRHDLVGRGLGRAFVTSILRFATDRFSPERVRLLILGLNDRSRKGAEALGFERRGEIQSPEGTFLVMVRETSKDALSREEAGPTRS